MHGNLLQYELKILIQVENVTVQTDRNFARNFEPLL